MKRLAISLVILSTAAIIGALWYGAGVKLSSPAPVDRPVKAPLPLELREIAIATPHWAGAPIKIALLAHIDVGSPRSQPQQLDEIVGRVNVERPDIILLAGGYVHGDTPQPSRSKADNDTVNWGHAILGDLNAPLGVFAVLGKPDYQYGGDVVRTNMEMQGINFVDNQAAVVDNRLCVFGIGDENLGNPSDNGYYNCPANFPIIALMHNPKSASRVPSGTALMLAGQGTHGLKAVGGGMVLTTTGISASGDASIAPQFTLIELSSP